MLEFCQVLGLVPRWGVAPLPEAAVPALSMAGQEWYCTSVEVEDVIIRRATSSDIERAAALGAEIVRLHHRTDPERFFMLDDIEQGYAWWLRQEVDRADAVVLLAERQGEIVGYCYGAIEDRDWSVLLDRHGALHDLFVVEAARRGGVARALTTAMIRELKKLGASILVLRAMVQNEAARQLAASLGFRATMVEMVRAAVPSDD